MTQIELLGTINEKSSLTDIQEYIEKAVDMRGFTNQPIQDTMLLLLEEVGELAKAIRKTETSLSVDVDKPQSYSTVENEAADVFFVLAAVCNKFNINLFKALVEKEKANCTRNWALSLRAKSDIS